MKVFSHMAWPSNIIWVTDMLFYFFTCFCTGPFMNCTCTLPPLPPGPARDFHKPNRIRIDALSRHNLSSHLFSSSTSSFFLRVDTCDLADSTFIVETIPERTLICNNLLFCWGTNLNHSSNSLQCWWSKPVIHPTAKLVSSLVAMSQFGNVGYLSHCFSRWHSFLFRSIKWDIKHWKLKWQQTRDIMLHTVDNTCDSLWIRDSEETSLCWQILGLWEVSGHIPCKLWQAASSFSSSTLIQIIPYVQSASSLLISFVLLLSLLFYFQLQVRHECSLALKYLNNTSLK